MHLVCALRWYTFDLGNEEAKAPGASKETDIDIPVAPYTTYRGSDH